MLKNLLICYDTRASACSQGLDIQLIVLLTSETSDPPVTYNPTKGNIIGCHLIRINVKAPVRWTRPWNFTVRCKMWFPWKTHLRCENGAETAPDGSAKSAWMFQWICFHWARTKTKQNKKKQPTGQRKNWLSRPQTWTCQPCDSDCAKASSRLKRHTGAVGSAGAVCFRQGWQARRAPVSGASLNFSKRCCLLSAQLVALHQPWRASLTLKVFRSV